MEEDDLSFDFEENLTQQQLQQQQLRQRLQQEQQERLQQQQAQTRAAPAGPHSSAVQGGAGFVGGQGAINNPRRHFRQVCTACDFLQPDCRTSEVLAGCLPQRIYEAGAASCTSVSSAVELTDHHSEHVRMPGFVPDGCVAY